MVKTQTDGKTIKVKKDTEEKAAENQRAAEKLMDALVNTPDNRMGEMTYLPRTQGFLLSLQHCMNPVYVFDPDIDIVELWELTYMKYLRSVGGEHLDRIARLAEMEMAGDTGDDEDAFKGPEQ